MSNNLNQAVNKIETNLINISNNLDYNGVKFSVFGNEENKEITIYATNVEYNHMDFLLTELSNMGSDIFQEFDIEVEAVADESDKVEYESNFGICLAKV